MIYVASLAFPHSLQSLHPSLLLLIKDSNQTYDVSSYLTLGQVAPSAHSHPLCLPDHLLSVNPSGLSLPLLIPLTHLFDP